MINTFDLLQSVNAALIRRQECADDKKREITTTLRTAIDAPETVARFHAAMNASGNHRAMYPLFYMPPDQGGEKLRLITGDLPTTHILSANHYELEILRLLVLWDAGHDKTAEMVERTLGRLDQACFGRFCPKGECVGASVAALRFISAVRPANDARVVALLNALAEKADGIAGQASTRKNLPVFYFWLAVSGIQSDQAAHLIRKHSPFLLALLKKGWLTGPATLDTYNILRKYVIRNTLAVLPEYAHLKEARVFISKKDGRCYGDA